MDDFPLKDVLYVALFWLVVIYVISAMTHMGAS